MKCRYLCAEHGYWILRPAKRVLRRLGHGARTILLLRHDHRAGGHAAKQTCLAITRLGDRSPGRPSTSMPCSTSSAAAWWLDRCRSGVHAALDDGEGYLSQAGHRASGAHPVATSRNADDKRVLRLACSPNNRGRPLSAAPRWRRNPHLRDHHFMPPKYHVGFRWPLRRHYRWIDGCRLDLHLPYEH